MGCLVGRDARQVNSGGRKSVFEFDKVAAHGGELWQRSRPAASGAWRAVAGGGRVQVRAAAAGERAGRPQRVRDGIRADGQVRGGGRRVTRDA
jgi:hypothetical protein